MNFQAKPFLKWAGGKTKIVPLLNEYLGNEGRLIELFVGSGAVFMGTNFNEYLLGDVNSDLIGLLNNIKNRSDEIIRHVEEIFDKEFNTEEMYYSLRNEFNNLKSDDLRKSVLFIYLNRHSFNGLCRYNKKGFFNVPYGRYSAPTAPIKEMKLFADKCKKAEFVCCDFSKTFDMAREGDVVYCDPPYVPISSTENFTAYSKDGFGENNQISLAKLAESSRDRKIKVVISNHDTEFTRKIYSNASAIHELDVYRSISSKSKSRKKVKELIAVYN